MREAWCACACAKARGEWVGRPGTQRTSCGRKCSIPKLQRMHTLHHATYTALPRCLVYSWQLSSERLEPKLVLQYESRGSATRKEPARAGEKKNQPRTYSTQAKLANDTAPPPGGRAPVFDRRRPRVATESVQLELRLVAHLWGERLVARDVEVRAA
jgi:hypothetical protein